MTVKVTRLDMTAGDIRKHAAQTKDADAARRMLAIAFVLENCSRAEAARACGMDRQTLRDWVHRFNEFGLAGLVQKPHGGGAKPRLTAAQKAEIADWVENGPDIQADGIVRWRLADLAKRIKEKFAVTLHERSVGRLLHGLNFSRISVRPRHPKARYLRPGDTQKNFANLVAGVIPATARHKPIELWWQDEARVGRQGTLTYIWAKTGSRPAGLRDLRYTWAYLFGAVCPARGVGTALVLPHANAHAMNLHLNAISRDILPAHHAVLIVDGAGWHQLGCKLIVPDNISLLHLPPYSPELNPVENIWQFLRQNLSQQSRLRKLHRHRGRLLRRLAKTRSHARYHPLHRPTRLDQNGQHMSPLV